MKKLSAILVALVFSLTGAAALAADPPKPEAVKTDAAKAAAALKKPADVTQEAWDKMTDAEKKAAVEKAAKAAPKKEKKGGC